MDNRIIYMCEYRLFDLLCKDNVVDAIYQKKITVLDKGKDH